MVHPACELVVSACNRILKQVPKKHTKLIEDCTALLDHLDEVLQPASVENPPHLPPPSRKLPTEAPPPPAAATESDGNAEISADVSSADADVPPADASSALQPPPEPQPSAPASAYVYTSFGPTSQMALSYESCEAVLGLLRQALDCERQPVVEAAMDCAQRLVAFKFMQVRAGLVSNEKELQDRYTVWYTL